MKTEKAIEILKNCATLGCEYHFKGACNKTLEEREDDFKEAINLAVEALNGKQNRTAWHDANVVQPTEDIEVMCKGHYGKRKWKAIGMCDGNGDWSLYIDLPKSVVPDRWRYIDWSDYE